MLALLMGVKSMSCHEVQALPPEQRACVFDVNDGSRWSLARVPGARNLDPSGFTRDELPADTDALLVFYCSNPMCRKAPTAARRAKAMGYSNVRIMAAGIQGWRAANLPVEP
ncbi:rhodanese-like domain-containing protein [Lysobacter sp. A3-1-A15]|uniref:rhodanese-like domain-containing protein n=1 Tax=Novilysobacter viscosus TaxID=3098602 RepID=UPI002ED9956E